MFKLPNGYSIFGYSNNGNTMTAIKDGSTAAKPMLILIDRTPSVYNAARGTFSVPVYRVRVNYGTVDVDGNPKPERLLVDASFRTPVGTDGDHQAWFADLLDLISEEDFLSDGIEQHKLPTPQSQSEVA